MKVRSTVHHAEQLRRLKKYSEQLNSMIEDGSFYRLSFVERFKLVRRVKKLYNRLLGPISPVKLKHVLAAASVLVVGSGCIMPSDSTNSTLRTSSDGDEVEGGGSTTVPGTTLKLLLENYQVNYAGLEPKSGQVDVGNGEFPSYYNYLSQGVGFVDLDSDGDLDAVFSGQRHYKYFNTSLDGYELLYRENTGGPLSPSFGPLEQLNVAGDPYGSGQLAFADMDGDGDKDMWMASSSYVEGYGEMGPNRLGFDGFVYYENVGGSSAEFERQATFSNDASFMRTISIGDVDGDGDYDLLVGRYGQVSLYENTGTAEDYSFNFSNPQANPFGMQLYSPGNPEYHHQQAQFLDLDKDGDLDVIVTHSNAYYDEHSMYAEIATLFVNNGSPSNPQFAEPTVAANLQAAGYGYFGFLQFFDLDSDGDPDLFGHNTFGYNDSETFYVENTSIK